jgi:hypothetical protein
MLDTDDPALWYALNRLIADYWADVDDNAGRHAHEFYVPEALYIVGNNRFEGADKIRAFYTRRRQHGTITTRHLVGNLRAFREDAGRARAVGVMSLYRADGPPPIERMRPPAMIADFEARACSATTGCGGFSHTSFGRFSSAATGRLRSRSTRNVCNGAGYLRRPKFRRHQKGLDVLFRAGRGCISRARSLET